MLNSNDTQASYYKHVIPSTGFLRLPQIIGNPKAKPPIPALIPVSKSSWWDGIQKGIYPEAVKIGARTTAWRVEDIHELIVQLGGNKQ